MARRSRAHFKEDTVTWRGHRETEKIPTKLTDSELEGSNERLGLPRRDFELRLSDLTLSDAAFLRFGLNSVRSPFEFELIPWDTAAVESGGRAGGGVVGVVLQGVKEPGRQLNQTTGTADAVFAVVGAVSEVRYAVLAGTSALYRADAAFQLGPRVVDFVRRGREIRREVVSWAEMDPVRRAKRSLATLGMTPSKSLPRPSIHEIIRDPIRAPQGSE